MQPLEILASLYIQLEIPIFIEEFKYPFFLFRYLRIRVLTSQILSFMLVSCGSVSILRASTVGFVASIILFICLQGFCYLIYSSFKDVLLISLILLDRSSRISFMSSYLAIFLASFLANSEVYPLVLFLLASIKLFLFLFPYLLFTISNFSYFWKLVSSYLLFGQTFFQDFLTLTRKSLEMALRVGSGYLFVTFCLNYLILEPKERQF